MGRPHMSQGLTLKLTSKMLRDSEILTFFTVEEGRRMFYGAQFFHFVESKIVTEALRQIVVGKNQQKSQYEGFGVIR